MTTPDADNEAFMRRARLVSPPINREDPLVLSVASLLIRLGWLVFAVWTVLQVLQVVARVLAL